MFNYSMPYCKLSGRSFPKEMMSLPRSEEWRLHLLRPGLSLHSRDRPRTNRLGMDSYQGVDERFPLRRGSHPL